MQNTDPLFKYIHPNQLEHKQVAHWWDGTTWPTYQLCRQPYNIHEIITASAATPHHQGIAIWMENGTLTYLVPQLFYPVERLDTFFAENIYLEFHHDNNNNNNNNKETSLTCIVTGHSNHVIAETALYFCSLRHSNENQSTCLTMNYHYHHKGRQFDFDIIPAHRFAQIMDHNPTRVLSLEALIINEMQSVFLATRPFPISLTLGSNLILQDGGCAFVHALLHRQSTFGSLKLLSDPKRNHVMRNWEYDTIQYLFQVTTIEKLVVEGSFCHSVVRHVFTSSIDDIYFHNESDTCSQFVRLQSQNRISLAVIYYHQQFPSHSIYSYLCHLNLFNFTRIDLLIHGQSEIPIQIIQHLIDFLATNTNLEELVVIDCVPSSSINLLQQVFQICERLTKLRLLRIREYPIHLDHEYSWLKQLLSRNRHIEAVQKRGGQVVTDDGFYVDPLYSLNRFYRGLTNSRKEETEGSLPLIIMRLFFLRRHATKNNVFQRSALLLTHYSDILCELIQLAMNEIH